MSLQPPTGVDGQSGCLAEGVIGPLYILIVHSPYMLYAPFPNLCVVLVYGCSIVTPAHGMEVNLGDAVAFCTMCY